jgi:hypothetical protein
MFKFGKKPLIKEYRRYRTASMDLNHKIIQSCLHRDAFMESARSLGMVKNDTIVFADEDETNVLMDFALHEYRVDGKTSVEHYRETKGGKNKIERNLLNFWLAASTSLFKITSITQSQPFLILEDLIAPKNPVKLVDIAFSRSAVPGLLMFLRLVPFKEAFMTSGFTFVFHPALDDRLVKGYKDSCLKKDRPADSRRRFIYFFKANRKDGMEVRHE